jgi:hypothetical protein
MTGIELAAMIRFKTGTNTTTFTNGDMLPLVIAFKNEIASEIAKKNQMYFAVPATEDLVDDQREYALSDNQLNNLIKVEIKFAAGDARQPAKALKEYEQSETESEIVAHFSNAQDNFKYIIRRRALFILSGTIVAVTAGLRIWFIQFPADPSLTGNTDLRVDPSDKTAGFPLQFHELLARRVAMEWKGSQPKPIPLSSLERGYASDLEAQLDAISQTDLNLEIIGEEEPPADQGDYGFNY